MPFQNKWHKGQIMSYELEGKVVKTGNVERFDKFVCCRFWVEIPHEKYPQVVEVEAAGDKSVERASVLKRGDTVKLKFDLRGKRVKCKDGAERVFNGLRVWHIEVIESAADPEPEDKDADGAGDETMPF